MTIYDQSPTHSPLTQSITRDGKTLQIHIYEDGEGGWLLEVEDEYGNSTVWDDSFSSDRDALDEALNAITEDGIDSLIGAPAKEKKHQELDHPLSEAELTELDEFLGDESLQETSMDVATLEGYLTAIAIGPRFVPPSQWLPWVWDMDDGEAEPEFANSEHFNRILSLIMRYHNAVLQSFATNPGSFEPIFWRGNQWGAAEWCEGFLLGVQFNEEAWALLSVGQPKWFAPFMRLGTDEGIDITKSKGDAEIWMNEIEPSLVRFHAYWQETRESQFADSVSNDFHFGAQKEVVPIVRSGPKIGRNDPCPCGSGAKFKRCCGIAAAPPTLH